MSLPMNHMPTRGIPYVLPVAFCHWHPFLGLETMPNRLIVYPHVCKLEHSDEPKVTENSVPPSGNTCAVISKNQFNYIC